MYPLPRLTNGHDFATLTFSLVFSVDTSVYIYTNL